jgi:hypothetical protein
MSDEIIRTAILDTIGQASMLWSELPTGVFQDQKAIELAESLLLFLRSQAPEAEGHPKS